MKRRTYLASFSSVLLAGNSGCLGLFSNKPKFQFEKPIVDVEFSTGYPVTFDYPGKPPVVAFHPRIWTVEIMGTIRSGDTACNTVEIERIAYENTTKRLEITIINNDEPAGEGCTAIGRIVAYQASITFDEILPDVVYAIEDSGEHSANQSTLATRS